MGCPDSPGHAGSEASGSLPSSSPARAPCATAGRPSS